MAKMSNKLTALLLSFLAIICYCLGSSVEFMAVPDYLQLKQSTDSLQLEKLSDVVTQAMGFTPSTKVDWTGLQPKSLFNRPRANLLVVDHHDSPQTQMDSSDLLDEPLNQRLADVFDSGTPPLMLLLTAGHKLIVSDDRYQHLFEDVPRLSKDDFGSVLSLLDEPERLVLEKQMSEADPSVTRLLKEMSLVSRVADKVASTSSVLEDGVSDSYVLHLAALGAVARAHATDSPVYVASASLADKLVKQAVSRLSTAYSGHLLAERVRVPRGATPAWSGRKLLQTPTTAAPPPNRPRNAASVHDALFPVTFNIILFLTLLLLFAVVLVSHSLWYMDPGRDSIIYRMTTQRLKKD